MRKTALLRALLLEEGLETPQDWATTVEDRCGDVEDEDHGEERDAAPTPPLVAAIEEVVPHLPDYSAVSSKLRALLGYVGVAYPGQADWLVQGWLQRTPVCSVPFRRWVLCDWLKCSHLTSADPAALLQRRYALLVAVLNEKDIQLKRVLLGYVDAVNAALPEQSDLGSSLSRTSSAALGSIETVEDLLDFYWRHAEQLASRSMLCAAKLHALAVRTQRSAKKLVEDEDVLVRLRWSIMLKPLLFQPLLQHAIALKVVPGKFPVAQIWTSDELAGLVGLVDLASREKMLAEMEASKEKLAHAFASGVKHVHLPQSDTKEASGVEDAAAKYVASLSADQRKLLLAELEQDLDDAPPHLFPHIFMVFRLVIGGLLSSEAAPKLLVDAVATLLYLFDHRSHDLSSCLDALALLLQLSLAKHAFWYDNAPFYLNFIEALFETATIQVEPKVKWAAQMALQQLLFECDVQLLRMHQADLRHILPPNTMRFVSIRLQS
ncbi:unnamed protein product [Phytophthora fragariaefolia]|uniref:Unnamed protein product n=1 Tax=Phytophthora fragariaefolia TaxID=1490495 RepID=A0A9W6Y4H0_9STRA|nr:unnamed protein product [Phytophthora fragariaefolia]